ncbi:MAG TPA: isoprenylcysteine carboxylmethyltransferase family protein [Polyangiaceae bacterium]|nr:isoprenylcysteine carboxylmethyltransferase family protein [Polyangiaceae bacterium]
MLDRQGRRGLVEVEPASDLNPKGLRDLNHDGRIDMAMTSDCGVNVFLASPRLAALARLDLRLGCVSMLLGRSMSPLKIIATGLNVLLWPTLILTLGGDVRWVEAWIFDVWFVSLCAGTIVWLARENPALLAERYRASGGGQKGWDRFAVAGLMLGFLSWIALMPLDARRFRWSPPFPLTVEMLGGALLLGASFFLFRSFRDNTYLSPLVRIQSERQHSVVTTGVYGFVRHPMYLGALLMFFGGPLLLGSVAGVALAFALTLLLAARAMGEEKMLLEELAGYAEYRNKVRYRLIPGVW